MRILFLSPRQCWPARSGAKLREYHFLRALGLRAEVTYLYFTEPGSAPLTHDDLPFCRQIQGIPKPASYGPALLLRGLAGPRPLTILNYVSAQMRGALENLLAATPFDFVHIDIIHMMPYEDLIRARSAAKVFYNWHNIESEAMRRYSATVNSPLRRWYAGLTAGKLQKCEQEILRTAAGHVVCSDRERQQLLSWAPSARIATIPNGVDTASFTGLWARDSVEPRDLVFVGSMDYYPNADAAASFCQTIWPHVREKLPGTRLLIVGANPPDRIQALAQMPGVAVTGTVPDVRPYYRNALAAIVPLRTGSGTRLKILEAMAAGVPVISTPLGAEGLDISPGRNILIAEPGAADQWKGHLLRLVDTSDGLRSQLTVAGLELVKSRYDWQVLGESLWNTYQSWLGK